MTHMISPLFRFVINVFVHTFYLHDKERQRKTQLYIDIHTGIPNIMTKKTQNLLHLALQKFHPTQLGIRPSCLSMLFSQLPG